jgi:mandelate racemase
MLDAMKIGGVSGWLRAAPLAEAASVPVSSHLFIEFSSHLLAATAGRHWQEWLDLAAPIRLGGEPHFANGLARPSTGPGAGLEWDETAVRRFAAG